MAEYIKREALITFANNHKGSLIDSNDIARFPAADVVGVVRCKDCEHWTPTWRAETLGAKMGYRRMGYCRCVQWENDYFEIETEGDDFCSYGERRCD